MGDKVSIPGSERFSEVGNGNPLQYSCLGNPMDRGACLATVYGVTKESDMTYVYKYTHTYTHIHTYTYTHICINYSEMLGNKRKNPSDPFT